MLNKFTDKIATCKFWVWLDTCMNVLMVTYRRCVVLCLALFQASALVNNSQYHYKFARNYYVRPRAN